MKTSLDALEVIRKMALRYGDGQIAAVLNKSGLRTGKGKRWTQTRVATARRNYSISGQREAILDPDILTLSQAAKHCCVSQYTIQQLVKRGLLENNQVVTHAPWELRREDLESEPIRKTLDRLKRTGRLLPEGGHLRSQIALPLENKEDDNEGYYG